MTPISKGRLGIECLLGGLLIYAVSLGGLKFYSIAGTLAVPLWPSSGIALGLLLLRGWRLFPAITLGTVAATMTLGDPLLFSISSSVGNTLESLIGWFLMVRVFGFSTSMTRVNDLLVLILVGAPWGAMVNALLCTLGLVDVGFLKPDGIATSFHLFWTGDVLGILVFTPLVLRFSQRWKEGNLLDASLRDSFWLTVLCLAVILGFGLEDTAHSEFIAIAYISFPLMVWLAFVWRRDVTFALALVTILMTAFTATGHGPLVRYDPMATYSEMTVFIAVYEIACLIIMAASEEVRESSARALEHRLSSAQKETELQSIRANLNPHFLFNSLNAIKSLVSEDPAKAQKAILSLSEILRSSLRMTRRERVPLRDELSLISDYLELQKIRHEERLAWKILVDSEFSGVDVPPLMLHQLVENAVKHGVEVFQGHSEILIEAFLENGKLLLRVTGPGLLEKDHHEGTGFLSIRNGLESLYGHDASFTIRSPREGCVVSEISFPVAS